MNKIQKAIHNKVNSAMGEVEYQTDCFIDGGYKSKFSMLKYLEQIKFKRKLIELMKLDIQHQLDEITSDDPQLIEGYDFMTKGQKTKYQNYLQKLEQHLNLKNIQNLINKKDNSKNKEMVENIKRARNYLNNLVSKKKW